MDIGSKHGYPASALSNFSPHPFIVVWREFTLECNSMEGFLQSLKFKNPNMQKYVATLVGYMAKKKGREKNWKVQGILWWNGEPIDRFSVEYQDLLDVAYDALATNNSFRNALLASENSVLIHTMGKSNPTETILTKSEFCNRLTKIRERIR